jgi:hypothetical protein
MIYCLFELTHIQRSLLLWHTTENTFAMKYGTTKCGAPSANADRSDHIPNLKPTMTAADDRNMTVAPEDCALREKRRRDVRATVRPAGNAKCLRVDLPQHACSIALIPSNTVNPPPSA